MKVYLLFCITNHEAILATTTYRLSKQKKNDFKLREDDAVLTNLQTEVPHHACLTY